MKFNTFVHISHHSWERYLRRITNLDRAGRISQVDDDGVVSPSTLLLLYPSILICVKTDEYFITELIGSQPAFSGLVLKKHSTPSINHYFYQFDLDAADPALVIDNKQYLEFNGLCFSHDVDLEALHRRFPFLAASNAPQIRCGNGTGSVISITNRSNFISFQDCTLVNRFSTAIRVKRLQQVVVIHRTTTPPEYTHYLNGFLNSSHIYGSLFVNADKEAPNQVAGQFVNVYLSPGLRETTIGQFFRSHPQFVRQAFCTSHFEYEPYLEWKEGSLDPLEHAINPDLMIRRPDGHYDIYDLKTALLSKASLTKGKRPRRRFIDYIAEGAAQAAHYASYFNFPKNREYAFARYNITVEDPRLVLIVGNSENLNRAHVDEACRILKNFEIIDYDTILHLYLNSQCRTQPQVTDHLDPRTTSFNN